MTKKKLITFAVIAIVAIAIIHKFCPKCQARLAAMRGKTTAEA